MCRHMFVITINEKTVHEFEKEQRGTHVRTWREEREMGNDAIILLSQEIKKMKFSYVLQHG